MSAPVLRVSVFGGLMSGPKGGYVSLLIETDSPTGKDFGAEMKALIEAAPDMLETLESVAACNDCGDGAGRCNGCNHIIKAALAKARGEA